MKDEDVDMFTMSFDFCNAFYNRKRYIFTSKTNTVIYSSLHFLKYIDFFPRHGMSHHITGGKDALLPAGSAVLSFFGSGLFLCVLLSVCPARRT